MKKFHNQNFMSKQLDISFKQVVFVFLIVVVLPNTVLDLLRSFLGSHRSYINLDYFFPFIFLVSRNTVMRIVGVITFMFVSIIDLGIIMIEFFPTLNLRDIFYLLGFVFSADKFSIFLFLFAIVYVAISTCLNFKLSKKVKPAALWLGFCVFAGIHTLLHLALPYNSTWSKNFLTESRIAFFVENQNRNFWNISNAYMLYASPWQNATKPWFDASEQGKPINKKLFLVTLESWGMPNDPSVYSETLKKLNEKHHLFEYFEQGSFQFLGLTAQAELRELCRLDTLSLDLREVKSGFQHCLPHFFKRSGYKTYAAHGATGFMYGRDSWYKLAGFDKSVFAEQIKTKDLCVPFEGVCDWDVQPLLLKELGENEKIFAYWLTLTSHFYYAKRDIHNDRFQCENYNISEKTDACLNLKHITQFFDNFADILDRPEMKGVEVIIVGDHVPPVFGEKDFIFKREHPSSKRADVPWIHFKIKE